MALPKPEPGLVVCYCYLWHEEHLAGREEGIKDRPCAIVAAITSDKDGGTRVLVLPVTHAAPRDAAAVEIPADLKRRLKLDSARSWVVVSEWNEFTWPGPDLRPVSRGAASVAYGFLSSGFFNAVRKRFIEAVDAGRARKVRRTE